MAISDEELRDRLTSLGCDVGPIDDTTRPLYIAMLKRREGTEKSGRLSRSNKTTSNWISNTSTTYQTPSPAKPRSSGRTRSRRSQAFSSDDEEPVEAPASTKQPSTFNFRSNHAASYRRTLDSDNSSTPATSTMYPSPIEASSGSFEDSGSESGQSLFSVGLSPVRAEIPSLSLISRSNKYTRRPLHPQNNNSGNNINNSTGNHTGDNYQPLTSTGGTANGFSGDELDDPQQHHNYRSMSIFGSVRNKAIPSLYSTASQSTYSSGGTHGGMRTFRRSQPTPVTGGARSHFIPKLLIGVTAFFFVGLAILYYRLGVYATSSTGTVVPNAAEEIKHMTCAEQSIAGGNKTNVVNEEGYTCIRQELFKESLTAAKEIQMLLAEKKYAQICGQGDADLDEEGELSYEKAARFIKKSLDDEIFSGAVYLIRENPSWGVEISRDNKDSFLMPLYPAPFWCRLQRAVMQMFLQTVLFVIFIVLVACTYWVFQNRKINLRKRRRQINGFVEDITDLLTNNAADNPDTPYLPILEIRDKLLPSAATSRSMAQLWQEVEEKFEGAECARVAREKQRVRGEWFQVWRWLPPPTMSNGQWGMGSKVWQGKAFDGSSAGEPLTNCLKIKNMFNKLEERGEGWVRDVERELISKCGPNHGIVHMHVAEDSPDGIVYAKMVSHGAAGEVYRKLHGSWFDRRLVTAKYLREKRYHEKFPESINLSSQMEL